MPVVNRHDPHIGLANMWHAHLASGDRTAHPSVDEKGNRETVSQSPSMDMEMDTVNATFPPNREGAWIEDR
jgi:hypothetical protein